MKPQLRQAIARVTAKRLEGGTVTGTAFLVTDRHLLTAFHVVGDRIASREHGQPVFYSDVKVSFADSKLFELPTHVVEGCSDPISDWALLELNEPVSGVPVIPLGTLSNDESEQLIRGTSPQGFESWGFPTMARLTGSGLAIDGRIQNQEAVYQAAWAYQLYSDNAAAAFGTSFNGLSGAPCIIDGAAVGIIRANLIGTAETDGSNHVAAGVLYACPIATSTLQEHCAKYLPSLDPIRGLPGLPRQDLPLEPFRYLRWYGAKHVEVFFGRNRRVRDLYFQVIDGDSPPIILFYGSSGVGKSSLLEAGLLPRLLLNYEVGVQRRETTKTLAQSLQQQLVSAQSLAQTSGKPVIILLDQIEEVFTDRRVSGNTELTELAQRIRDVVTSPGRGPKIILGFRSEWLANVRARLLESKLSFSEFYLERLAQGEIEEVVRGIVSTERLRQFYRMPVDESLPQRVADDLASDPKSPVSPLLSIILTRLWIDAKTKRAGAQRLSQDVYDLRMRNRLDLDQFLAEQIKAVASDRQADVTSGLVNDVLYRHTTDDATARELSWDELCRTYSHLAEQNDHSYLQALIASLTAHSLLYSVEGLGGLALKEDAQQITRLAHDTLAIPVRKNYQRSDALGQRALRRLTSRIEDWRPDDPDVGTLDANALALVEQAARGTRGFTDNERKFLRASDIACRRQRWRSRLNAFAGLLFVSTLVVGVVMWWKGPLLKAEAYRIAFARPLPAEQELGLTPGRSFKECSDCPEMVVLPGGRFKMGSVEQRFTDEHPQHEVTITRLAVAKFELTFKEWNTCVSYGQCEGDKPDRGWSGAKQPVINVTWKDAQQYVKWLSRVTGKKYRLLSESEWEYAARGGTMTSFSFGNDDAELSAYAWFASEEDRRPRPVGLKKQNKFGLHDMHGNVSEWVEDCWRNNYRDRRPDGSAWTSSSGCNYRAIRGGSFEDQPINLRSAARDFATLDKPREQTGIRVGRALLAVADK